MPRSGSSRADAALIAALARRGVHVSVYQLERWRTAGMIPRNQRRGLGQGRGSTSTAPDPLIVEMVARVAKQGRAHPFGDPLVQFACGQPVSEGPVRAELSSEIDRFIRAFAADAGTGDDADDARHAAAASIARRAGPMPDFAVLTQFAAGQPEPREIPPAEMRSIMTVLGQVVAGGIESISTEDTVRALAGLVLPEPEVDSLIDDLHTRELAGDLPSSPPAVADPSLPYLRRLALEAPLELLQRAAGAALQVSQVTFGCAMTAVVVAPGTFDEVFADPLWTAYGRFGAPPSTRSQMRAVIALNGSFLVYQGERAIAAVEEYVRKCTRTLVDALEGRFGQRYNEPR